MSTKHQEAFHIMAYQCDKCSFLEYIWNSRDGVTPFMTSCLFDDCDGLTAHVFPRRMGLMEQTAIILKPFVSRVFVDMTQERAKMFAIKRMDSMIDQGYILPEGEDYYQSIDRLTQSLYHNGDAPDVLSRAEYLALNGDAII